MHHIYSSLIVLLLLLGNLISHHIPVARIPVFIVVVRVLILQVNN